MTRFTGLWLTSFFLTVHAPLRGQGPAADLGVRPAFPLAGMPALGVSPGKEAAARWSQMSLQEKMQFVRNQENVKQWLRLRKKEGTPFAQKGKALSSSPSEEGRRVFRVEGMEWVCLYSSRGIRSCRPGQQAGETEAPLQAPAESPGGKAQ